jgi:hypothetical protein
VTRDEALKIVSYHHWNAPHDWDYGKALGFLEGYEQAVMAVVAIARNYAMGPQRFDSDPSINASMTADAIAHTAIALLDEKQKKS